jgi:hypothetical protein
MKIAIKTSLLAKGYVNVYSSHNLILSFQYYLVVLFSLDIKDSSAYNLLILYCLENSDELNFILIH